MVNEGWAVCGVAAGGERSEPAFEVVEKVLTTPNRQGYAAPAAGAGLDGGRLDQAVTVTVVDGAEPTAAERLVEVDRCMVLEHHVEHEDESVSMRVLDDGRHQLLGSAELAVFGIDEEPDGDRHALELTSGSRLQPHRGGVVVTAGFGKGDMTDSRVGDKRGPGGKLPGWGEPGPGVLDSLDRVAVDRVNADEHLCESIEVVGPSWSDDRGHQSSTGIE